MRGTLTFGELEHVAERIIPACAGNTPHTRRPCPRTGDHPRMCGEHEPQRGFFARAPGSSPHVRGTPRTGRACRCSAGIIPACAGNTTHHARPTRRHRDHPRMCGEHPNTDRPEGEKWGSSPHVRGTLMNHIASSPSVGIIPACAGNTRAPTTPSSKCKDHPRMCGEHHVGRVLHQVGLGSSPHVRGTHSRG